MKDMVDPSGRSGAASGRRAARTPARTGRAAGRRRGAGAQARPEPWPRFGYLFDNAAADNRLRIAPALAALGAAAAPGLAAWQAGMGGGVAEDSAVLRWIAGRFAAWLSQPHALRPAEDEAPVLPGPPAAATLAPLDPGRVTADLVNAAPGLPGAADPARRAALHALLHRLCDPATLADTLRHGAPLHAAMTQRFGTATVALETAIALAAVLTPARPLAEGLVAGYRLSLPTAQGVRMAYAQVAARAGLAALPPAPGAPGAGPGAAEQRALLARHGFDRHTPLGWYLAREAQQAEARGRLGPLGSRLLAEAVLGPDQASTPRLPLTPPDAAARALDALHRARQEGEGGGASGGDHAV